MRLRHRLDAARDALTFVQGRTRSDLDADRQLALALLKAVEIIGEAAVHIPDASRATISGIPWQDLIGMGHRLVHAYYDVNHDILWDTVTRELPPLIAALEERLSA